MTFSFRPAWAVVAGVTLAVPLSAQRNVPSVYAITNARIVPVSAPVIPTGTVVVRDGVITAVGASAAVPGDAQVIDGTGLTVYPGFIDGYGTLALPAPTSSGGGGGGAAGRAAAAATTRPTGAPNSTNVVGMQPEMAVVDLLDPEVASFTPAHAAGFTAAFTAAGTGVFRGSAALINLIGTDVSAMIVKPSVAQSVGFSRGGGGFGGGYPGSLFAVFAALRQELLDAQRYHELTLVYDRNPRGVKRPAYDASLEALQPVLTRQQPVVMFANSEREIIRALDLAKEFNLRVIIAGGSEAYLVADRLKADNVPVLLSVNFPRRSAAAATGGSADGGEADGRGGAPADDEPELMRVLRERVEAPKSPGRLATAGVRVVFESASNFTEYLANVRRAVAAGLPADQALRAMTIAPAELFGVGDRMGTIETGKIANLTITKGDLFDSGARVTQLFIDGEPTIIPAPTASAQNARTP